jgi:hypothetical protein
VGVSVPDHFTVKEQVPLERQGFMDQNRGEADDQPLAVDPNYLPAVFWTNRRLPSNLGWKHQEGSPMRRWTSRSSTLQALTIVKEMTGNGVLAQAVDKIHRGVKEGESFTPVMDGIAVFPATLVTMVDVGEQTGALPSMLAKAADNYF